jgi:membrane protease subunit (stomatin/prohibitin family)
MALFGKNANEAAFVGGKKHWTDVIKNTGDGNLLIWRQPEEDFNTQSTLIVMPGEEAIFIKGGNVEQVFDSGTYKLSTENYPFLGRLHNAFSGGISTFNCVVYFIRKSHSMELLWGTVSPIQVRDKLLGIATQLKGRGSYKVQVENGTKFLNKMLGNNVDFLVQDGLDMYFANEFQSKIKSSITRALLETDAELLGIESRLDELVENITPLLAPILEDYGLRLINFVVAALDMDDPSGFRKRYDEAGIGAYETRIAAQADAQKILLEKQVAAQGKTLDYQAEKSGLDMLGGDWGRLQSANILRDLANNPNSGGIAAAGAGVGMGMAAGSVFSGMAQQMFSPLQPQSPQSPQPPQSSGRFTQKSAPSTEAVPVKSAADEIMKLKGLLDAGILSQEEFDAGKKKLLGL